MSDTTAQFRKQGAHAGSWISIGDPIIAELSAAFPFDWMLFDLEHGFSNESRILSNLQAARREGLAHVVRVGSLDTALIAKVLDLGAHGIMLPHVNHKSEAEACIMAMYYPPLGNRGFSGSARAFNFGLADIKEQVKEFSPLFMAQIETLEAVAHAEEIAAVQGVDVLFVGPADLNLDWTTNASPNKSTDFDSLLTQVATAALHQGKQAGILVKNLSDIPRLKDIGYTVFSIASDIGILRAGYDAIMKKWGEL